MIGQAQFAALFALLDGPATGRKALMERAALAVVPPWGVCGAGTVWDATNTGRVTRDLLRKGLIAAKVGRKTATGRLPKTAVYALTEKGREYLAWRRQRWELANGAGNAAWSEVEGLGEVRRWTGREMLDAGWRCVVEYGPVWGWRFKLTRPDGLESEWIYTARQDETGAKEEARATWMHYAKS